MRRVLLCLALLPTWWMWDPVTTDCKGRPELDPPSIRYLVTQLQTEPAGYRRDCAIDEDGAEVCVDNILYHPADILAEDLVAETRFPQESVAVPPLGGVTFIDIEAEDPAGNISGGVCE